MRVIGVVSKVSTGKQGQGSRNKERRNPLILVFGSELLDYLTYWHEILYEDTLEQFGPRRTKANVHGHTGKIVFQNTKIFKKKNKVKAFLFHRQKTEMIALKLTENEVRPGLTSAVIVFSTLCRHDVTEVDLASASRG